MPTIKQKSALKKTLENGGNITKAMREVGYSKATINSPANLTKSKGFKALLKDSGLDENLVVGALVEDINKKPQNRARELALGAKLLGMIKKEIPPEQNEGNPYVIQLIHYGSKKSMREREKKLT